MAIADRGQPKARAWMEVTNKSKDAADCVPAGSTIAGPVCAPQASRGVDATVGFSRKLAGLGVYGRFMRGLETQAATYGT